MALAAAERSPFVGPPYVVRRCRVRRHYRAGPPGPRAGRVAACHRLPRVGGRGARPLAARRARGRATGAHPAPDGRRLDPQLGRTRARGHRRRARPPRNRAGRRGASHRAPPGSRPLAARPAAAAPGARSRRGGSPPGGLRRHRGHRPHARRPPRRPGPDRRGRGRRLAAPARDGHRWAPPRRGRDAGTTRHRTGEAGGGRLRAARRWTTSSGGCGPPTTSTDRWRSTA